MKKTIVSLIIIFAVLGVFALSCFADSLSDFNVSVVSYDDTTRLVRLSLSNLSRARWQIYDENGDLSLSVRSNTVTFPSGFTSKFNVEPFDTRCTSDIFNGAVSGGNLVIVYRFDIPIFANLGRPSFSRLVCRFNYYSVPSGAGGAGVSSYYNGEMSPYVPGESSFTLTFTIPLSDLNDAPYFVCTSYFDFSNLAEWVGVTATLQDFYFEFDESSFYVQELQTSQTNALLTEIKEYLQNEPSGIDDFISNYDNEMSGIVAEMSEVDAQQSAILEDIPLPNETSALSDFSAFDTSDFNDFWGNPKLSQFMLWFGVIGVAAFTLVLYRKLLIG